MTTDRPTTEGPGAIIGPYKLREQIGEGGFGVVYVAEQEKPVRRKVALKIIKPGMDTKDVIARFEAERQALALMDHPNVARVLDAGATESGRPFFVMELVHGLPITEFCDKNKLPMGERLLLFGEICRAVQHAHQKGIIHRDLKPSNIMVTLHDGKPVPKVIDFGVSKALSQQLTEKSIYTAYGQMIGTPSYMSPEQAEMSGLGIDTRSDVYSLGVLLYELLTGKTPLDARRLREGGYGEMLRIIPDEEPPRPSLKISTLGEEATAIAQHRHTDPAQLRRSLRGELDWIVMKCLEKDRSRWYETAVGLARDVERYLQDEPVEACPPSAAYRLRKFARKHKASLAAAVAFAGLLLLGAAVSTWQAVRANLAEATARRAAEAAQSAKAAETLERERAEASERAAKENEQIAERERDVARGAQGDLRRSLYASDMRYISGAWEMGDTTHVVDSLNRQIPKPGEHDLRGFEWRYWHRMANGLRTVALPTQNLGSVGISPDGRLIAGFFGEPKQSTDNVGIWDLATGKQLFVLDEWSAKNIGGGVSTVYSRLEFSADGERLAYAITVIARTRTNSNEAREVRFGVFDLKQRRKVSEFTRQNASPVLGYSRSRINGLFSPDLRRIVLIEQAPPRPVILDVETGQETVALEDLPTDFDYLSLSLGASGNRVAAGFGVATETLESPGGKLYVWDATTGKRLLNKTWPGHPRPNVALNPDGTRLAAGDFGNNSLSMFDVASEEQLWSSRSPVPYTTQSLRFSENGQYLACSSVNESRVALFDASTGAVLSSFSGHSTRICNNGVQFVAGGRQLAAAARNGMVKFWSLPELAVAAAPGLGTKVVMDATGTRAAVFTPSRRRSSSLSVFERVPGRSEISIRDMSGRETLRFREHQAPVTSVCILPGGQAAASIDESGAVLLWDPRSGVVNYRMTVEAGPIPPEDPTDPERWPWVGIDEDHAHLYALVDPSTGLTLFDAETNRAVFELKDTPFVAGFDLSPDGSRLAAYAEPVRWGVTPIKVWSVPSGNLLCELPEQRFQHWNYSAAADALITTVRPKQEGRSNVLPDTKVIVWDAATGIERVSFMIAQGYGRILAISPDGTRLITDRDVGAEPFTSPQEVVVWDLTTGRELFQLRGAFARGIGGDLQATFSPDGRRIATCSPTLVTRSLPKNAEVKFWDAATGDELGCLARDADATLLSFSPDGHRLIACGPSSIRVWDASPLPEKQ